MTKTPTRVNISSRLVLRLVFGCVAVLAACDIAGQTLKALTTHDHALGFIPKFSLELEGNVPTFFSTLLLMTASMLLFVIARIKHTQRAAFTKHWYFLSLVFFYLSFDEMIQVHELFINPTTRSLSGGISLFHYSWVIVALPMVAVLGLCYLRFLKHLPKPFGMWFMLAGGVYVSAALGLEMVEGYIDRTHGSMAIHRVVTSVEEVMEMIGVATFIHALIRYIESFYMPINLAVTARAKPCPVSHTTAPTPPRQLDPSFAKTIVGIDTPRDILTDARTPLRLFPIDDPIEATNESAARLLEDNLMSTRNQILITTSDQPPAASLGQDQDHHELNAII